MSTTVMSPIYYGYEGSPLVGKVETILLLKNIPARRVDVAVYLPRPELSTMIGLPYRRVPVLALGRDIYIDSSLIAIVLEKHFPAPQHPTIFPPRKSTGRTDVGLQAVFAQFYADRTFFNIGFGLLPWTRVSAALRADRKKLVDIDVDFDAVSKQQPVVLSTLASHLTLFEEQLSDGREWLLDTEMPGYTDVSVHSSLAWVRSFRDTRPVFNVTQFPRTVTWLNKMDAIVKQKRQASPPPLTKISGTEAAKAIFSSSFSDISSTGFDQVEAKRLGITLATRISVRPDDTGRYVETVGKVVALNREEVILETEAVEGGPESIRVHFPRLGYVIQPASKTQTKL